MPVCGGPAGLSDLIRIRGDWLMTKRAYGLKFAARSGICAVLALLWTGMGSAQSAPKPYPVMSTPSGSKGAAAITALGSNLSAVASWYGWTEDRLRSELLADRPDAALRLDSKGRLYLQEDLFEGVSISPQVMLQPAFPADTTFNLESKPDAKRSIALVFRGEDTAAALASSSFGLPAGLPPFSRDSDPALDTDEHARIQQIWSAVAEYFGPFDVNVTTKQLQPDQMSRNRHDDDSYGVSVVISSGLNRTCANCDGIAFLNSFGSLDNETRQIVVNADSFSYNPASIAHAIAHLVGHSLGLSDDLQAVAGTDGATALLRRGAEGTTVQSVVPIMGQARGVPFKHFDMGEYADAVNTEDDFKVVARNGLPLRADDHGFSRIRSTPLEAGFWAGRAYGTVQGAIERTNDWDAFSFNADAGDINAEVKPGGITPNINLGLALYDARGKLVKLLDPDDSLGAKFTVPVSTAGTYYLQVRGAAPAEMPDVRHYGNRGTYTLTADYLPTGQVGPSACFTAVAPSFLPGSAVNFSAAATDASGVYDYSWDFGDGTSRNSKSVTSATKVFNKAGTYTVRLRVTNGRGFNTVSSRQVTIYPSLQAEQQAQFGPVADVTLSDSVRAPVTLYVNALYSRQGSDVLGWCGPAGNAIVNYEIALTDDRGGREVSTDGFTSFRISEVGDYTVTVRVQDRSGRWSEPLTKRVQVIGTQPLVASFTSSPASGDPLTMLFQASTSVTDRNVGIYDWDWGDGTRTRGYSPASAHSFPAPGTYTVTLTVSDNDGLSNTTSASVVVLPPTLGVSFQFGRSIFARPTPSGKYYAELFLLTVDGYGKSVGDVDVNWTVTGTENASGTARSERSGFTRVVLPLPRPRSVTGPLCVSVTINGASKPGWSYEGEPLTVDYCPRALQVEKPVLELQPSGSGFIATARVMVKDQHGRPAPDAVVRANWLGSPGTVEATTDSSGLATFVSQPSPGESCFLLSVEDAVKDGFAYDVSGNKAAVTCSTSVIVRADEVAANP